MKAQNLVGGVWDDNPQANTYKTVNPITKASLPTNFQEASKQQIQISVNKASEVFDLYSSISFAERIKFLSSIKSGLLKKSDKILEIFQMSLHFLNHVLRASFNVLLIKLKILLNYLRKDLLLNL